MASATRGATDRRVVGLIFRESRYHILPPPAARASSSSSPSSRAFSLSLLSILARATEPLLLVSRFLASRSFRMPGCGFPLHEKLNSVRFYFIRFFHLTFALAVPCV